MAYFITNIKIVREGSQANKLLDGRIEPKTSRVVCPNIIGADGKPRKKIAAGVNDGVAGASIIVVRTSVPGGIVPRCRSNARTLLLKIAKLAHPSRLRINETIDKETL